MFKESNERSSDMQSQMSNQLTPFQCRFMSIKQWVTNFGYIPEGGIRHLIFSNPSFNQKVVKRIGKKVLLDVIALESWILEQNGV